MEETGMRRETGGRGKAHAATGDPMVVGHQHEASPGDSTSLAGDNVVLGEAVFSVTNRAETMGAIALRGDCPSPNGEVDKISLMV